MVIAVVLVGPVILAFAGAGIPLFLIPGARLPTPPATGRNASYRVRSSQRRNAINTHRTRNPRATNSMLATRLLVKK